MTNTHPSNVPRVALTEWDLAVLKCLEMREGRPTEVHLADGPVLVVHNFAPIDDLGNQKSSYVATNVSPEVKGASIDFFFTESVLTLADPAAGTAILERSDLRT